jgi:C4-dicarboxylate transporter
LSERGVHDKAIVGRPYLKSAGAQSGNANEYAFASMVAQVAGSTATSLITSLSARLIPGDLASGAAHR